MASTPCDYLPKHYREKSWPGVQKYPNLRSRSLVSSADPLEAVRADEGVSSQAYLTPLTFPSRISLSQQEEHLLASGVHHGS